jgi:hypothetical protein
MAEEKNIKGKINELDIYHTDAYTIAVANGFKGTVEEWLEYLRGKNAYELAVMSGFKGTEAEWLESLKGGAVITDTVLQGQDANGGNIYEQTFRDNTKQTFTAPRGIQGKDGRSAYQVAVDNGFKGTEAEWVASVENVLSDITKEKEKMLAEIELAAEIVQATGDSATAVMSQNAVSVELENANQKILRNDKRITNLEQGLTPDPFETDNSMAYQKDVPANALPYAEISKVGGMTYKDGYTLRSAPVTEVKSVGVNLFDISKLSGMDRLVVSGDKINVTTVSDNSGVTSASRIKDVAPQLNVGDIVTLTAITTGSDKYIYLEEALMPWYYGESKTITEVMLNSRITFYASGVSTYATISDIMLNKGSTALPYTPYVEHTLPIPEAVQAIEGYGQGNPDDTEEYNAIIWDEEGKCKYLR